MQRTIFIKLGILGFFLMWAVTYASARGFASIGACAVLAAMIPLMMFPWAYDPPWKLLPAWSFAAVMVPGLISSMMVGKSEDCAGIVFVCAIVASCVGVIGLFLPSRACRKF